MSKVNAVQYLGYSDYIKDRTPEREVLFRNWLGIVGFDTFAAEVWALKSFKFMLLEDTTIVDGLTVGSVDVKISDNAFIIIDIIIDGDRNIICSTSNTGSGEVKTEAEVGDVHSYVHKILRKFAEEYYHNHG